MKTISAILRFFLSSIFIYFSYKETGIFTAILFMLIIFGWEWTVDHLGQIMIEGEKKTRDNLEKRHTEP